MLSTRIRPALLLAASCFLLASVGRPDEKDKTPDTKTTREQLRAELEAKLSGRTPDEMLSFLNQLAQEWTARKGGYEVAYQRFTTQVDEWKKAETRYRGLKEVDAKAPLLLRAADVEPAIKSAQQFVDYQNARVRHLEAIKSALTATKHAAAEFDRAASAAEDQLFRLEVAARIFTKANGAGKLPDAAAAPKLEESAKQIQSLRMTVTKAQPEMSLAKVEQQIVDAKATAATALTRLDELKRTREATLAAFAFEEQVKGMNARQLTDEFARLRKQLAEKTAAIQGDANDYQKAMPPVAEARAKLNAVKEPPVPADDKTPPTLPLLEQATRKLFTAQQYLSARVRTADERTEKAHAVVAALDELEKKAKAYAKTLDDAWQAAGQLAIVAAEIERRVGRGELDSSKVPEGVAEAATTAGERAKLSADAATVQNKLTELRAERETLRKPDPEADNLKMLTAAVLAEIRARIDLLTDLKKLAADYATARKDRTESEQRRMDQRAVERRKQEVGPWHWLYALDHSQQATEISALLDAYYKELIDLDEKAENLKLQKESLERLVELTRKEADDIAKLRLLLGRPTASDNAGAPKSRGQLEREQLDAWLAARLAPPGLKAEAALYHDEQARLAAVNGANARRVQALTGNAPPESGKAGPEQTQLSANGGEIGRARSDLLEAHIRGWTITGSKIGLVLLAALIIPRVLMLILRRAIRGGTDAAGNPSPALSALRRVLKVGVWIAAIALILSVFGYDVTALVIGLAIGVLAVALAARPMIADVLGSVVIFAERRFQVGDVVRMAGGEPARVVGLSWRSTALKNSSGLVSSVPNRRVTEMTVENLSRSGETYDSLAVTISTDKDAGKVIGVIRAALAQCKNLTPDQGVTVLKFNQKGHMKVVEYRFWWFLKDYEARNKTRDEVFARIALGLANEDMTGIEVSLA
jgi:small-conductance mechanosensitive channel